MCHNQSVFQVIGYKKSQKTGHTDVILSFYIMLHPMLCCVDEHYDAEIACLEPISDAYILSYMISLPYLPGASPIFAVRILN